VEVSKLWLEANWSVVYFSLKARFDGKPISLPTGSTSIYGDATGARYRKALPKMLFRSLRAATASDVVLVCSETGLAMPFAYLTARATGRPFVVYVQCIPEHAYEVRLRPQLRPIWRHCLVHADAVLCVSPASAKSAARLGVAPPRITVASTGIDVDAAQQRAGIDAPLEAARNEPPRIVACGELEVHKGCDILIRALASVRRTGRHVTLTVLGRGPERAALERLAHDLGVSDAIAFLGHVDNPLPEIARADAFVHSARVDAAPLVLLEALALGVPTIAADCEAGGPRMILDGGRLGRLVEPESFSALADAICAHLDNPADLSARARGAAAHLRGHFAPARTAAICRAVMTHVCESRQSRGKALAAKLRARLKSPRKSGHIRFVWWVAAPDRASRPGIHRRLDWPTPMDVHLAHPSDVSQVAKSAHPRVLDLEPGELVRVRPAREILSTLDERGALENLPFMPEMVKYCGRTVTVSKRADKTCGPDHGLRRMENTVHLANVRCDGQAHGGCQAACLMYWKEAWLERLVPESAHQAPNPTHDEDASLAETLLAGTTNGDASDRNGHNWRCQATEIPRASTQLHGWYFDQYARDARNWGLSKVLRVLLVEAFNRAQSLSRRQLPRYLRFRGGQTYPFIAGSSDNGNAPSANLGLQPGDLVRVKSKEEIVRTLDQTNHNRGLSFDVEMVKYCGRVATVRARVRQIIDEESGKMIHIKSDCIILEGVTCTSDYHRLCPRGIYPYWREIWLEKIEQ
jgi:glycosyltransferase involved in cell wall biosynthesis